MLTAVVLINTDIGAESDVLKDLNKLKEEIKTSDLGDIIIAIAVYGVYDIVVLITAKTMDKLKELVTWKIRRLDKVRATLTMIKVDTEGIPNIMPQFQ